MEANRDRAGRMRVPHYNIWKTNTEHLIGEFSSALPSLVTIFYGQDLITEEDKDQLIKQARKESNRKAARRFVELLLNRGESILPYIITTLREAKYITAADRLEKEMNAPPVDSIVSLGKMNPGHLGVWKGLISILVENFKNDLTNLIGAFREALILGDDDKETIMNIDQDQKCQNPSAGAGALVAALANSGPDVLPKIIKVLDAKGFTFLAEELQKGIDKLNPMKRGELQRWLSNTDYLVIKMKERTPEMLDIFINAGIITQDDKAAIEEAEQKEEPPNGTRKLVNMLAYRGEDAFSKIKEALQNAGYGDIIDNLNDVVDELPEVPQDEPEAP